MTQLINYQVLARTTRPTKFSELIGQEALTQTLKNAIESGRLAHAFILTGTRGVGKTTTARLMARSLNCVGADGKGQPTSEPCGLCDQCQAVGEDRHVDVIEVDAATRTGVDDMRQLMEGINYKPVMGRYKIYIIDEVHMLSKNAFNSLLKTLEEPPPHVKFIFATTEIRKVPLTILSRCQRFDLRRIPADVLAAHFKNILEKEKISFEDEAIDCIAGAAEGSARDGLSILEQAIVSGVGGKITLSGVQSMLGLSDREKIAHLFELVMKGSVADSLDAVRSLYMEGADAELILQDLLEMTYQVLAYKTAGSTKLPGPKLPELAAQISAENLMLVWQVLIKGVEEMKVSSLLLENLEVILIRAMHIQGMMSPQKDAEGYAAARPEALGVASGKASVAVPAAESIKPVLPQWAPKDFEDVVHLFEKKREPMIVDYLTHSVGLVHFEPGLIKINLCRPGAENFQAKVSKLLSEYTGSSWTVEVVHDKGQAPLGIQHQRVQEERQKAALSTDEAKKIAELFPGAQVVVK